MNPPDLSDQEIERRLEKLATSRRGIEAAYRYGVWFAQDVDASGAPNVRALIDGIRSTQVVAPKSTGVWDGVAKSEIIAWVLVVILALAVCYLTIFR